MQRLCLQFSKGDIKAQREMPTFQAAAVPIQAMGSNGIERDINHSGSRNTSQTIRSCGTERDVNHSGSRNTSQTIRSCGTERDINHSGSSANPGHGI
jgi:hypothetical protein